jgi:hypothetical protein
MDDAPAIRDAVRDETVTAPNQWWGYRHISGMVQAKRFLDDDDRRSIRCAYESSFIAEVVEPFPAETRDDALSIIAKRTRLSPLARPDAAALVHGRDREGEPVCGGAELPAPLTFAEPGEAVTCPDCRVLLGPLREAHRRLMGHP